MTNKRQKSVLTLLQFILYAFAFPVTGHAATALKNCFTAPQDYQVSYNRELSTTDNVAGNAISDNEHLVGRGAEMEANCS